MSGTFMAERAEAQTPSYSLYGITAGANATIHQIDFTAAGANVPRNGSTSSALFNTGLKNVNGLAWDNTNSRLFYHGALSTATTNDNAQSGTGLFYTWARGATSQSEVTRLGGVDVSSMVFANASFYNGAYYSVATGTDDLYKFAFTVSGTVANPVYQYTASLLVSNVDGATGSNGAGDGDTLYFGDIAINSNGRLYGYAQDNGTSQFFQGDIPANASTTLGGTPTNSAHGTDPLIQLGFARSGSTVGGTLHGHDRTTGQWYTVNTDTGVQTSAGFTSVGFNDITSGATYQPVPAPPAAISMGIGGLVGMIGTGVNRMRLRRKKK